MKCCRILAFAVCALWAFQSSVLAESLMMATTTSTQDSGLLEYLAPVFAQETGIELKWVAVGTGKALELGKNCDADVLLVHAPKAEQDFIAAGFGLERQEIMYNDFVLVGPVNDPAGIKGLPVDQALKRLAEKQQGFVSRGDNSGTHKMEHMLWNTAKCAVPDEQKWYFQAGQGMMACLVMAAEKNAYVLSDRATFISYEIKNAVSPLAILVEGDKKLRNQYSVMMVNPKICPQTKEKEAHSFLDWWVLPQTQQRIATFRLQNKQLFFPNAVKK